MQCLFLFPIRILQQQLHVQKITSSIGYNKTKVIDSTKISKYKENPITYQIKQLRLRNSSNYDKKTSQKSGYRHITYERKKQINALPRSLNKHKITLSKVMEFRKRCPITNALVLEYTSRTLTLVHQKPTAGTVRQYFFD